MSQQSPSSIGKYNILSVIGRGAMGVVYKAQDSKIERIVALKTIYLAPGLEEEKVQEYSERFIREARAAGKLSHPNIVVIHDADDGKGTNIPYIVMEYIEGETLSSIIHKKKEITPLQILNIMSQIGEALDYAHRHEVIHRDIKPSNIILMEKGNVKLMDFGIAKVPTSELTREGQFIGTPSYMSPEQILGKGVDGRSDLFSLGIVFYELLTGQKPFLGDNISSITHNIVSSEPTPAGKLRPDLMQTFDVALRKCLAKDKEKRYQSGAQFVDDIENLKKAEEPQIANKDFLENRTLISSENKESTTPEPQVEKEIQKPVEKPERVKKHRHLIKPITIMIGVTLLVTVGLWYISRLSPEDLSLTAPILRIDENDSNKPDEKTLIEIGTDSKLPAGEKQTKQKRSWANIYGENREANLQNVRNTQESKKNNEKKEEKEQVVEEKMAVMQYTFSHHIVVGEFALSVDGKEIKTAHIERGLFTAIKSQTITGSIQLNPGTHDVEVHITTKNQNVNATHKETVNFEMGSTKSLKIDIINADRQIRFTWK